MVIQLSEFGLQTHCFQTSQGHPRDGQQEGYTFVPIRKPQKAFKDPVAYCSFQLVLVLITMVQVAQEALRIFFAFIRWLHLIQKHTSNLELVCPF